MIVISIVVGCLLGVLIGLLISSNYTLMAKIKVQKMKWEIDIYEKIRKI